jgi:hypothetical protein
MRDMILGLSVAALLLVATVTRAEADPVLFQFQTQIPMAGLLNSPIGGFSFSGSFLFDGMGFDFSGIPVPGNSALFSPITSAHIQLGPHTFNLPQLGAFDLGPLLFGPNFVFGPEQLVPLGLAHFSITGAAGLLSISYSWIDPSTGTTLFGPVGSLCVATPGGCTVSYTQLPPQSVPEPTTLCAILGGIAGLAVRRFRFSRNLAPSSLPQRVRIRHSSV